jgi:sugar lactone lactonase YvrE
MRAEQITGAVAVHGEGPVWDEIGGRLVMVDMGTDAVLVVDGDRVERRDQPEKVTALRPRAAGGGWVLGTGSGFALTDADGQWQRTIRLWDDPGLRMNDGACDPAGRFYCGSMAQAQTVGAGTLYRLDPDLQVTPVLRGLTISNGLAWAPDGTCAYFVDSWARTLDVLHLDDAGNVVERRPLVEVSGGGPVPDGLTVDADGGIWVAVYGAGEVRRYDPSGQLSVVVEVAVPKPTACTFGGADHGDLFITTTQEDLDLAEHPNSGAVFRIRIGGVEGLPTARFAG